MQLFVDPGKQPNRGVRKAVPDSLRNGRLEEDKAAMFLRELLDGCKNVCKAFVKRHRQHLKENQRMSEESRGSVAVDCMVSKSEGVKWTRGIVPRHIGQPSFEMLVSVSVCDIDSELWNTTCEYSYITVEGKFCEDLRYDPNLRLGILRNKIINICNGKC